MKTTKTLLALIAVAAVVACSKDDVSYGDLDGTYEASKIIYSFDGNTIATITPESEKWEYYLDFEKFKFEGQNVTIWEYGDWYALPYAIDGDWISIVGDAFRIKKFSRSFSLYWYPYIDMLEVDTNHNPKYEDEWLKQAEIIDTYKGEDIYEIDGEISFYYENGKPVFCDTFDDDEEHYWFDTIEYIYKKK
ncbi:MAG: hypothetical protein ACI3Z0_03480 [Candidatus Cryptobacteroides sp.]